MKNKITAFMEELIIYDYILFGSIFCLFIILIIIGILKREKPSTSIFIFILAFTVVILGSTVGYIQMHKFLYKNEISLTKQKKLTYTKAVIVYGKVKNVSNFDFAMCSIKVSAYKVSGNAFKDFIFPFNPFKETSALEYDIFKGQEREFKVILEPFNYSKDYNISLGASCR